ncbi:MAG TPA: PA0069 family radical SAM protein [Steroidobacteraceae bacterium]|nr:PA0069 family radical SAM protein [Steroidobacteraceae bacterium]
MNSRPRALKGRGALSNPPGRFDAQQISAVDDGWYMEAEPDSIATTLEPDKARGVITTNDSPDIPFEQSINPYRGCAHACVYCAAPETPILMADGTTRELGGLRAGDEIYGTRREGVCRRYTRTRVLDRWCVIKPAYRVTLEDGTQLTTGGDHRFLSDRGWKFVTGTEWGRSRRPHLTTLDKLTGTGRFAAPVHRDFEYRRGYFCGMIRGDGYLATYAYGHREQTQAFNRFRLAPCGLEALERTKTWLSHAHVETRQFALSAGSARPVQAIRVQTAAAVRHIREPTAWPSSPSRAWQAGFLAGLFDAEGSYSRGILRVSNTDSQIIDQFVAGLRAYGFQFTIEHEDRSGTEPRSFVRLTGGLREHLRFFHTTDPAITRKRDIEGQALENAAHLRVVSIEPLGRAMRLVDITTGTGDYISNGVISHNCYARPSHAYMGLSPGLDFETRLFYKADAARTLEAELSRPGYVCKPVMLGANTDPYQPVERRMKVTRSILEVLERTRHPVAVITKSALVLRDLDLLGSLARDNLASVSISVTTLDDELKRKLEPRAASPAARVRTLAALAAAGVPCGAMVAPVIPALTDHEMESILEACAAAGARWAGYVLLRLPYEIKDLFREWLAAHYPERAAHVMSLIRDMRGGRDNDPSFGSRMRGTGPYALLLRSRFKLACRRLGLDSTARGSLDTALFRPPGPAGAQLRLGL